MENNKMNYMPDLIEKKEWSQDEFLGRCKIAGIGKDTAEKIQEGKSNITVETLFKMGKVLGVSSISELIEFV